MVLNAAVQMLREADELKQNILNSKSGVSMLQDRNLWATQQQLQKLYQKILILDLDYALEKKVEQDLWNVGFKQQIEVLQAISKDRKSPLRSEAQAMLSWVLQAAAGFYLCLLHQICTTFKLDLPFRRRASMLGAVEGWEASAGGAVGSAGCVGGAVGAGGAGARYASQHCLVHLGDLARYRHQLRLAHTFYRHALAVSAHSGQPYNQLALVSWRRGRRLCAVYWHVRSLLVRAPFPPAPANLARTLAAAAAAANTNSEKEVPMPVLPGITSRSTPAAAAERIDEHSYANELLRALHYIHTVEQLDTAKELVENLNRSLPPLIASDSFESMTLIKMACVIIWAVESCTEGGRVAASALGAEEAAAAALAHSLAAGALLALLLPAHAHEPPRRALPALKVWVQWVCARAAQCAGEAWRARPQLWPALARALNALSTHAHAHAPGDDTLETVPLPEDEELHGFVPLEEGFGALRFASRAAWDAYSVPELDAHDDDEGSVADAWSSGDGSRELRVRARRLQRLGAALARAHPHRLLCHTDEDGNMTFEATASDGEQLTQALTELALTPDSGTTVTNSNSADASPDTPTGPPPPPVVISEADFREKVREKRAGILKPQGSLERAREERALAGGAHDAHHAHDSPPPEASVSEESKSEEKKETRKPRVNIAMAAIMRKQEETNKQVKFVTPPPTPDSLVDSTETPLIKEEEKPKVIQPKAIKSLANLPAGRKVGGILSLKDKSAGYPHLVNVDPEPKKSEKDEKAEPKASQGSSQNSQHSYQQKRPDAPGMNWSANVPIQNYTDLSRMNFQKSYGPQSAGLVYGPGYPPPTPTNQGIKLPVVNPKEIDVRTAALQKQSSRQDMFPEANKFANHGYSLTGDKINFLNDLPPRFANQYRYWHVAQDTQLGENKFRDDSFKPSPGFGSQPRAGWPGGQADGYQHPAPWWKPDNAPLFNANYPNLQMNMNVPNYYSAAPANVPTPYRGVQYDPMARPAPANLLGQNKPEDLSGDYLQTTIGQPPLQPLQGLVTSPSFNSSMNSFSNYAPTYDSTMYPQFKNTAYPSLQMSMDKPGFQGTKDMDGLNFGGTLLDAPQRNLNYNESIIERRASDQPGVSGGAGAGVNAGAGAGSSYSLFSGAQEPAWPPQRLPQQSLWSGGPSPLERLLEQQKQLKPQ